jgi:hypothetical protein
MKKRVLGLPLMFVLLFAVATIPASAAPARKVTGSIEFTMPFGAVPPGEDPMAQCQAEFDAHEAVDGGPAKGSYRWKGYNAYTGWVWADFQVNCVTFGYDEDGPIAVFSGPVTDAGPAWWGVEEGEYLAIWVRDGGTPGRDGDSVGFYIGDEPPTFTSDPGCDPGGGGLVGRPLFRFPVTGGNLVVHR